MHKVIKYRSDEISRIQKDFPNLFLADNSVIKGELNFCARYKDIGCDGISQWVIEPCGRNEDNCIEDVYSIKILLNEKRKINGFPKVFETDKRIKNLAKFLNKSLNDLHLFEDDESCCLGIFSPSDELSLYGFVLERVYPYFFWQSYFYKHREIPPCGECPHNWKDAVNSRIEEEKKNLDFLHSRQKDNPTGNNRKTGNKILKIENRLSYLKTEAKEAEKAIKKQGKQTY